MDAKNNLFKSQKECFETFIAQRPKTGAFDAVFDFDGKKIYAHKCCLAEISPIFTSMLSDQRSSSQNDDIKIESYKYEDFKEFLIFIYSGQCNITDENIFVMADMAEFYGVKVFKEACEEYLSKMKIDINNVFKMLEIAAKYSLHQLREESLYPFIAESFTLLKQSQAFKLLDKSLMQKIVRAVYNSMVSEKVFKETFKWAENKAIKKQEEDENIVLNDAIKEELAGILPSIEFRRMNIDFLLKFVVTKSFLFSGEFLSDLLLQAWQIVFVKVTDRNGNTAKGFLFCPRMDEVVKVVRSLKNAYSFKSYWITLQQKLHISDCKLSKNDEIEWYLVYDSYGNLAVKKRNQIDVYEDFLLAEMFAEDGFQAGYNCLIGIVCSH